MLIKFKSASVAEILSKTSLLGAQLPCSQQYMYIESVLYI